VADGHTTAPERLVVALVRGVHGLRGAVRVEVLTDRPEVRFVPGAVLFREGSDEPLRIASAEAVADGPGWRLRFEAVRSREAADTLRGAYLEATLVPDAELARGEVYWHEVIGAAVVGVDGAKLGTVQDIYRVAENEVYVVGGGPYGSFDLPAVRAFIRIFAPRRGEIVVDAEALDLQPPRVRSADPDRPRAPRRRSPRRKPPATSGAADATRDVPGDSADTPSDASAGAPPDAP
jgi:16S rRNA processing protein RimM